MTDQYADNDPAAPMPQDPPSMNKDKALGWLLWLWVGVAIAAYLYQFKGFVGPILTLLGLS